MYVFIFLLLDLFIDALRGIFCLWFPFLPLAAYMRLLAILILLLFLSMPVSATLVMRKSNLGQIFQNICGKKFQIYMDEYKKENAKFKEASFKGKKEFYSNLNMEYITDAY